MDITNFSDIISPQIDWEHLHHISDSNAEFELELLQLFIEDSEEQLQSLKEAIALQDITAVEQFAHHIKGASANVGAIGMQNAADQIEQQARNKKLIATDHLVIELGLALQQIYRFVQSQ